MSKPTTQHRNGDDMETRDEFLARIQETIREEYFRGNGLWFDCGDYPQDEIDSNRQYQQSIAADLSRLERMSRGIE